MTMSSSDVRRHPRRRLWVWALLLLLGSGPALADKAETQVRQALERLRGTQLDTLSEREAAKLDDRLQKVLELSRKHRRAATAVIRELAAQEKDDFLLIELSYLLVLLEPDSQSQREAALWLERADPSRSASIFFHAASTMAATGCAPCQSAVLNMLKLDELSSYIDEHALPVNLQLGLVFAVGPYGDSIVDGLKSRVGEGTCSEKRNAAQMLGALAPLSFPEELSSVVLGDACEQAKSAAWIAMGVLGHPGITALVADRLEQKPGPSKEEQLSMVTALGSVYFSHVYEGLTRLSKSKEPEVAETAAKALKSLVDQEADTETLVRGIGSAAADSKAAMRKLLENAVRTGVFDFDGSALEIEQRVEISDLDLLNAARASVLKRRSDECLYEYRKLLLAAGLVRQVAVHQSGLER